MGDPFEGSVSKANIKLRPSVYQNKIPEKSLKQSSQFMEKIRYHTYLNCWHMNENESDAMWKLYAKNNTGIAIQSTYKNLVGVLNENDEVYIGAVNYIDYEKDWLPEGFTYWPFMHKQNSFKSENELRTILQRFPNIRNGISIDVPESVGINIPIEIHDLIEDIYIAPTSPEWFYKLVNSILDKYELQKKVIFSKLSEKPMY
ncbi:MAG: hypothetical protein OEM28_00410 [Nitrosopumilus sp.]|nr:hypothetical protein [Nitrosopumilus sp.]MDH3487331.1 hypothetical protein [Nitrosopumilus sp.]